MRASPVRRRGPRTRFLLLLLLVFSRTSGAAFFQRGDVEASADFTQQEYASLPRVCLAQKSINYALETPVVPKAERDLWYEKMGPGYKHIHHYCWGLMQLGRAARARSERVRNSNYRAAIDNFNYVINAANGDLPIMPEVHLRKGMALRLLGEEGGAAAEFGDAISIKPDYTPAYSALVDLHIDLGNIEEAARVLEIGLRNAPESKILAEKKKDLESLRASSRD